MSICCSSGDTSRVTLGIAGGYRLMPSYNGVVTISCIRTLAKLAIRFSHALPTVSYPSCLCWPIRFCFLDAAKYSSCVFMGKTMTQAGSYWSRNE